MGLETPVYEGALKSCMKTCVMVRNGKLCYAL